MNRHSQMRGEIPTDSDLRTERGAMLFLSVCMCVHACMYVGTHVWAQVHVWFMEVDGHSHPRSLFRLIHGDRVC